MQDAVLLSETFAAVVRRACVLVPGLAHVDPERVLVLAGRLAPRRLGETVGLREGRRPLSIAGSDALYAISFHARLALEPGPVGHGALDTVMHELWHVAPACDGTIRPMRHGATFDAIVRTMRREYLRAGGEPIATLGARDRVRVAALSRRADAGGVLRLRHRIVVLGDLVPGVLRYVCPAGHEISRHRRLTRPGSCSVCSPRFDRRYLLREVFD